MENKLIKGSDLKGVKLFRLTNKDECHNDFRYKTGLNIDTLPFDSDPSNECVPGGLYFSNEKHIMTFLNSDSKYIREVTLNDDEDVVMLIDEDGDVKYRAHSIILGERMDLAKSSTWEYLIDCGVKDDYVLNWAVWNGHSDVVEFLVEHGANVHADDDYVLKWAAWNGRSDVVKILVEHGADIHARDDCALRLAAWNGRSDVVEFLVEHGANVHADDDYALRLAAENGHSDVVKFLVEHGANVHADDDYALRLAALNGRSDVVKFLLEQGVDIHADDDYALRTAMVYNHQDVVDYLNSLK